MNIRSLQVKPDEIFAASLPERHLAGSSVRGGGATILGTGMVFAINMVRTVLLARLLVPADFGMIGMVAVVMNFAQMFKGAGLGFATVQKEVITHKLLSALIWMNFAVSITLGLVIALCAPLVAYVYGVPELRNVTMVLSLSFLLGGFTIQHHALLQRHMRFASLAMMEILAQSISTLVALLLAWMGWGYWSLVGGLLTHTCVFAVLCFVLCPLVPSLPTWHGEVAAMLGFGGNITGFNVINYFSRNTDNFLIGRYLGAMQLGFYDRAYRLLLFPISMLSGPLGSVAIPTLCRLRKDRDRLHRYYLNILYLLSLFMAPVVGIAFVSSEPIVLLLLGSEWMAVSDAYRYLAIGGLLQPLYNTQSWLHIAGERSDRLLRWSCVGTPILILSFVIGLPWGINGIAFVYSLAIVLVTPASLWYAGNSVGLNGVRIVRAVWRPIVACVITVCLMSLLPFEKIANAGVTLVLHAVLFLCIYIVLILILYGGIKPFRDVVDLLHLARAGR